MSEATPLVADNGVATAAKADTGLVVGGSSDQKKAAAARSLSMEDMADGGGGTRSRNWKKALTYIVCPLILVLAIVLHIAMSDNNKNKSSEQQNEQPVDDATATPETKKKQPIGPYKLVECQEGESFFDSYTFYDGADSLGSAGYNTYVGKPRATELGIANTTIESVKDIYGTSSDSSTSTASSDVNETFIYMKSTPTEDGPRESVRLEGKRRYDHGLFILDARHMPAGCGVWPAWWLTDETNWPRNGEIDIVEGVNYQTFAKTALHTSNECSMYAHVPNWAKTGTWDFATGIPNTFSGQPDYHTWKEADNCWVLAAHQWANQGCVAIDNYNNTIGQPFNANGGGVYALEWDPHKNRAIRSWAFTPHKYVPPNLQQALQTAGNDDAESRVMPDPDQWGLPYGYFAVGETTGCSADHLQNMHIVFNLAFCGTVAGNRYFADCPVESKEFNVNSDPWQSCNAYIKSEPKQLEEAYWKIRGVYVYERELETVDVEEEEGS